MIHDKIGIFAPEQHGDIALCTCVLKYKEILWPGKEIVWFCNLSEEKATYLDMLKFNDAIVEVRDWPKFKTMEDFRDCVDPNGQLKLSRRSDFESMKDLHNGYFLVPWAVLPSKAFEGVNYANIPRQICGADPSLEWHPYLCFSDEEREAARDFCKSLPHAKTIMLETQLRSAGNFNLSESVIREAMAACRAKFGNCNFIFASKMDHTKYVDDPGVVSASHFTVRQCALVHNYCDLFIGVCSGITQAVSCWGNKPVPRVEMCGEIIQSSVIANGPVTSFTCDNMSLDRMNAGFVQTISNVLNKF
tara:strand:- start:15723 stop:16634 length:912 start_codon:yes stop_codon:yes gene_type:complete